MDSQFVSKYVSHIPNENGLIDYSAKEHHVWSLLYERQSKLLPKRACDEFMQGLAYLDYSPTTIPQIPDVNRKLYAKTAWRVAPVEALISARAFFELLATRHFPVATFIRCEAELDYVQEPDIFHELFGHCPMLTNPVYADFVYNYARIVLSHPENDWPLLQRLFWFTVEFGLINTEEGLRAYGGGILSSISETVYAVDSDLPLRILFQPVVAFRMPYRIDELQPVYFVIDNYAQLYDMVNANMTEFIARARALGEYPPFFTVEENNPSIHILAC